MKRMARWTVLPFLMLGPTTAVGRAGFVAADRSWSMTSTPATPSTAPSPPPNQNLHPGAIQHFQPHLHGPRLVSSPHHETMSHEATPFLRKYWPSDSRELSSQGGLRPLHQSVTRTLRRTVMRTRRRIRPQVERIESRTLLRPGLDTTFGGTGMVTTLIQKSSASEAVAVQSDLKVVVAGQSIGADGLEHFTIARYNTNGTLDSTFGSGGIAIIPISTSANGLVGDGAYAVAIQPDGKIVVAGYDSVYANKKQLTYYDDWAVVRLNTNGSLDTTFGGGNGNVTTRLTPVLWLGDNYASSIVLQSNGDIVVGGDLSGVSHSGTIQGSAVVLYKPDGSLDKKFGTGGIVINTGIGAFAYEDWGQMIAIDGSGRIYISGESAAGTMAVARYLANGTLDSTFGTGGVASLPLPAGSSYAIASSIGLQSAGEIVVYGTADFPIANVPGGQPVPTLGRLNTNGSLDTSFGTDGLYTDSRLADATAMVIQPNDEIVAVGQGWVNGKSDSQFWVTLVVANGSAYDPTFGTNGLGEANFNMSTSGPKSVALGPDGNIVLTGGDPPPDSTNIYFSTARFLGDSSSASAVVASSTTFFEWGSHQQSRSSDRAARLRRRNVPELADDHQTSARDVKVSLWPRTCGWY